MRVLQEIFFAIIIVVGFFFCRAGKREVIKAYRKYWNEGWLRWVLVSVCIFIAAFGSAAFLWGAYHFAVLADQAWPLTGHPVSTGVLVFAGQVLLFCFLLLQKQGSNRSKKCLADDDADTWPIHSTGERR